MYIFFHSAWYEVGCTGKSISSSCTIIKPYRQGPYGSLWGETMPQNLWLYFFGSVNQTSKDNNLPLEKYTFFMSWSSLCIFISLLSEMPPPWRHLENILFSFSNAELCSLFQILSSDCFCRLLNYMPLQNQEREESGSKHITILNNGCYLVNLIIINSFYALIKKKKKHKSTLVFKLSREELKALGIFKPNVEFNEMHILISQMLC